MKTHSILIASLGLLIIASCDKKEIVSPQSQDTVKQLEEKKQQLTDNLENDYERITIIHREIQELEIRRDGISAELSQITTLKKQLTQEIENLKKKWEAETVGLLDGENASRETIAVGIHQLSSKLDQLIQENKTLKEKIKKLEN